MAQFYYVNRAEASASAPLGGGDPCAWRRDEKARHERILDVAEPNRGMEELSPFTDDLRDRLKAEMQLLAPM